MEPWYTESSSNGVTRGLLTAVLELGAWVGTLINGYLADAAGRRWTVVIACVVFTAGVIVQAILKDYTYIIAGRFVTGIGVGAFSMLVPLYNAELVSCCEDPSKSNHESLQS
jgi:MFS family permease